MTQGRPLATRGRWKSPWFFQLRGVLGLEEARFSWSSVVDDSWWSTTLNNHKYPAFLTNIHEPEILGSDGPNFPINELEDFELFWRPLDSDSTRDVAGGWLLSFTEL